MGDSTFTESALLDMVSDDGSSGFMLRIARHVDQGVSWLWLVTYGEGGFHGFVDDTLPCPNVRTIDDGHATSYEVEVPSTHGLTARLSRTGSAEVVTGGSCDIQVFGHATTEVPRGAGVVRMALEAEFRPMFERAGSNLPGRTESIVWVDATLGVGDSTYRLSGRGQFHEQLQDAPRFDTPFTYISLRGEHAAMVGIRGPRAGGVVLQGLDGPRGFGDFEIDPLDMAELYSTRKFRAGMGQASPTRVIGSITPTLRYTVPILGGRRPSAIVLGDLNGETVSGFVNDWFV